MSSVANFFNGKSVLLTGGTGFLGHCIAEKLLRCCPALDRLYLVVRSKRGSSPEERIKEMLADPFFDRARSETRDIEGRVVAVEGDCSLPGLGLSESQAREIRRSVSVVLHGAASTRLAEPLKCSIRNNLLTAVQLVKFVKSLERIESFVHISTAYCYIPETRFEEKIYEPPLSWKELMSLYEEMDEDSLEKLAPKIRKGRVYNYSLVKAAIEDYVDKEMRGYPACITRPAAVTPTLSEPVAGWQNNWFTLVGIMAPIYIGGVRTLNVTSNLHGNFVPCDMVVNAIIAAVYATSLRDQEEMDKGVSVYNITPSVEELVDYGTLFADLVKYTRQYPTTNMLAYPSSSFYRHPLLYNFWFFIRDFVPIVLMDLITFQTKNIRRKLELRQKLQVYQPAVNNDWFMETDKLKALWVSMSTEDKKMFPFDFSVIDWTEYAKTCILGMRQFLFRDPMSTLEEAKSKLQW